MNINRVNPGLSRVRQYLIRSYEPCPLYLLACLYSSHIDGGAMPQRVKGSPECRLGDLLRVRWVTNTRSSRVHY